MKIYYNNYFLLIKFFFNLILNFSLTNEFYNINVINDIILGLFIERMI